MLYGRCNEELTAPYGPWVQALGYYVSESSEDVLLEIIDTDDGARRIGELGIGCNPGIDRYMRNVYFDEKMNGTVHVALGGGFEYLGGTNTSAIHWDIVKDLRSGGHIELDGKIVQKDGVWID